LFGIQLELLSVMGSIDKIVVIILTIRSFLYQFESELSMTAGILDRVRSSCKEVVHGAKFVHLNEQNIPAFALSLIPELFQPQIFDPTHHFIGTPEDTLVHLGINSSVAKQPGLYPGKST
jgi:hypothetical protein